MSKSKHFYGREFSKPFLRHLRRSKTINVAEAKANADRKDVNIVSFRNLLGTSPTSPQPTLSCQALRHAVSALTRIDDFILEDLGGGFFANVYKAIHKVTKEEMVLKFNKDSGNRLNSLREVQLMNKLSHPNVLRFLGVCVHEGQLHALTEYIDGGTLEDLVQDLSQELPWTLRIKLSLDVAKGIHYLHNEGFFHRDLTSKNVLIKRRDLKTCQAIVADFGLATKIPNCNSEPLMPVGCPWWMAPEVILAKFYDHRADLFSFGVINLEMIARIDADPNTMPRTNKFGIDYMKICEIVDYCPLDFLQLVFKCVQIEPEKRPSSSTIITTLEIISKNLSLNSEDSFEFKHKRSKSEDNILQVGSNNLSCEEKYMTPQTMAQAMRDDDPYYCPAQANPFDNISLRDGLKVVDYVPSKYSRSSRHLELVDDLGQISGDRLSLSLNLSYCPVDEHESQSLPSSPVMLRRAAEKLHQISLHGSDVVKTGSRHDLVTSYSSDHQDMSDRSQSNISQSVCRTRSLGSLESFTPVRHRSKQSSQLFPTASDRSGFNDRSKEMLRESSYECLEDSLMEEIDSNTNHSMMSNVYHSCCSTGEVESLSMTGQSFSLSNSSLSSFISCDELSGVYIEPDRPALTEKPKRLPLTEKQNNVSDKPMLAAESGSFDWNHFSKDE